MSLDDFRSIIDGMVRREGTCESVALSGGEPTSHPQILELIRGDVFFWQSLMAGAVIVAVPLALVYNIFLNRLVAGLTLGAVKT